MTAKRGDLLGLPLAAQGFGLQALSRPELLLIYRNVASISGPPMHHRSAESLPDDNHLALAERQVCETEEQIERLMALIGDFGSNHRAIRIAEQLLATFQERLLVARTHLRLAHELRHARGSEDQA